MMNSEVFLNIGSRDGFRRNDFTNIGEPHLARCLYILRLLNQDALGVF